ncbi:uncharacterized protein J3R85_007226 [Psidium guajava]|nr:uncharacterized protein J3R85_007226 [Psidium guajava]
MNFCVSSTPADLIYKYTISLYRRTNYVIRGGRALKLSATTSRSKRRLCRFFFYNAVRKTFFKNKR